MSGLENLEHLRLEDFVIDLNSSAGGGDLLVNVSKLVSFRLDNCEMKMRPDFFHQFVNLEILQISDSNFPLLRLDHLSHLTKLRYLNLRIIDLADPNRKLTFLRNLTNLVVLRIDLGWEFDTIEDDTFKELKNLEVLEIRVAKLGNWLKYLGNLRELRLLDSVNDQEENVLGRIEEDLPQLEKLEVEKRIRMLKNGSFKGFKSLKSLGLSIHDIDETVTVEGLDELVELNLQLYQYKPKLFKMLRNVRKLSISISEGPIEADFFDNFPNLLDLEVIYTAINERTFSSLRNLRRLKIRNVNIRLAENVFVNLQNLKQLFLEGRFYILLNQANTFNGLENLRELELRTYQLPEFNLNIFNRIPKLKRLKLREHLIENVNLDMLRTRFPNISVDVQVEKRLYNFEPC